MIFVSMRTRAEDVVIRQLLSPTQNSLRANCLRFPQSGSLEAALPLLCKGVSAPSIKTGLL